MSDVIPAVPAGPSGGNEGRGPAPVPSFHRPNADGEVDVQRVEGLQHVDSNHRGEGPSAVPTASRVDDLIAMIKESADKLAQDRTSRGDLKILSRTLKELRYAFKVFSPYRSCRKITVFGSARTPADHPAYQQGVALGEPWPSTAGTWSPAAAGASWRPGTWYRPANAMGLNILLPFEQAANPVIAGDAKLVHMKYFFTRKLMFVKESDAMCMLPGGFGTLDEGLEVLTLLQTGKRDMVPVVFLDEPGGDYWRVFDGFVRRPAAGARPDCAEDLSLYKITDNVTEAVDEDAGLLPHLPQYALRARAGAAADAGPGGGPAGATQPRLCRHSGRGPFTVSGPLAEEREEALLADLPRLVFHFNRRNFGRLRQLIDVINAEC